MYNQTLFIIVNKYTITLNIYSQSVLFRGGDVSSLSPLIYNLYRKETVDVEERQGPPLDSPVVLVPLHQVNLIKLYYIILYTIYYYL